MVKAAIVGDTHGYLDMMFDMLQGEDYDIILQLGDFGTHISLENVDKAVKTHGLGDMKKYYDGSRKFLKPTYFIKGNHEDFDVIDKIRKGKVDNLYYLENGNVYTFGNTRIGILGGIFSESRHYLDKRHPKLFGGRRKHYNYQDIENLLMHDKEKHIDIILGHEAPKAVMTSKFGGLAGSYEINRLIKSIKPEKYFHGHHHYYEEYIAEDTHIIGLDQMIGKGETIYFLEL